MTTLHFTDEGSGAPLVFIHGYCESHTIWSEFVRPLTEHYRVICLDLPGFGKSPLPAGDFSIGQIAEMVWSVLDHIGVKACFVTGHSLGGYVTLEMAGLLPERMTGFCMFHSTAYADDENKKSNRTKVMEFVSKNGTAPFVQTLIPSLFADANHPQALAILKEAEKIAPEAVIAYARAMRDRREMTDLFSAFLKPVLFFAGLKDIVIPPESIIRQAAPLHKKVIHTLEDVGHMGMLEAPARTQSLLISFLQGGL